MLKASVQGIYIAAALVALLLSGVAFARLSTPASGQKVSATTLALARDIEARGLMTRQDFIRLDNITISADKSGHVPPQELKWAVRMLRAKPIVDTPTTRQGLIVVVLAHLGSVKSFTTAEKNVIFVTVVPWLTDPNPVFRKGGLHWLENLRDRKAIPYVKPLLKDTSPGVRAEAAKAMRLLSKSSKHT